jgi:hypothetical protein
VSEVVVPTVVVAAASDAAVLPATDPPPVSQAVSRGASAESTTVSDLAMGFRTSMFYASRAHATSTSQVRLSLRFRLRS